jgi:hypothetical protein
MSDPGVLSYEYKASSDLAQRVNRALITLKKAYYRLPGGAEIAPEEIRDSQDTLRWVIAALRHYFEPSPTDTASAPAQLPASLVARIARAKRGVLPRYARDLAETEQRLTSRYVDLADDDLDVLDEVSQFADAEASEIFRKLWRR